MEFKQANKITTHDAVIDAIEHYIISNNLKPGDPLPCEIELAEKLYVSRGAVRSGLQHFKTLGIISSKPKTGSYINRLLPKNPFLGYLPYLAARFRTIPEIGQMRMVIESGLISILFRKISTKDIEYLESLARSMANANDNELAELDRAFHSHLLDISNNELLKSLKPLLLVFFDEIQDKRENPINMTTFKEAVSQEHMNYVKALTNKDYEEMQRLIYRHYASFWNTSNDLDTQDHEISNRQTTD